MKIIISTILGLVLSTTIMAGNYSSYMDASKAANAAWKKRDWKTAAEAFQAVADLCANPRYKCDAIIASGSSLRMLKKYDEAIAKMEKVISLAKNFPDIAAKAYVEIYNCYFSQRDYEKAAEACETALKLKNIPSGNKCVVLTSLANALYFQKKYAEALEKAKQAAAVEKCNPYYCGYLANIYAGDSCRQLKKNVEALKYYQAAADNPKCAPAWRAVAYERIGNYLYRPQKKYDEAIQALEKGLAIPKLDNYWKSRLLYQTGIVYLNMNDKAKAKAAFEKVVNMDKPHNHYLKLANVQIKNLRK